MCLQGHSQEKREKVNICDMPWKMFATQMAKHGSAVNIWSFFFFLLIFFLNYYYFYPGEEKEMKTDTTLTKWRALPFYLKALMRWWALCTNQKPKRPEKHMKCYWASSMLLWEIRSANATTAFLKYSISVTSCVFYSLSHYIFTAAWYSLWSSWWSSGCAQEWQNEGQREATGSRAASRTCWWHALPRLSQSGQKDHRLRGGQRLAEYG